MTRATQHCSKSRNADSKHYNLSCSYDLYCTFKTTTMNIQEEHTNSLHINTKYLKSYRNTQTKYAIQKHSIKQLQLELRASSL